MSHTVFFGTWINSPTESCKTEDIFVRKNKDKLWTILHLVLFPRNGFFGNPKGRLYLASGASKWERGSFRCILWSLASFYIIKSHESLKCQAQKQNVRISWKTRDCLLGFARP
ncbi:hypothetical protein [Kurlavirus BKC-1]|nr:hypothetical protein [Kurlavirus BKC-1]